MANPTEKKIPARSETAPEFCWDLSALYPNTAAWEADFRKLNGKLKKLMRFKGHLGDSAETLRDAFQAEDDLGYLEGKLAVYASLKHDEDVANAENSARRDRISAIGSKIEGETAWFEPELLSLPKEKFNVFLKSPVLKFYKRTLTELNRERKHTLTAPEERILGMSSEALSTAGKVFGVLNDGDLRFPSIKDSRGGEVEITHGNYILYLEDADRRVRRDAFSACYDTYGKFSNTFAAILDGTVKTGVLEAKLRHYPSALAAALQDDNIPVSVYENLIETVHRNLPSLYRYFELRAKVLGLKKLDMYDIMNPLVPDAADKIPWDEAVRLVKRALKPLGETYCGVADSAFRERWMDVFENRGKRSGAYSGGFFRTPPYLLLNHADNLDSVFTLIHEMGHSMHSYFSDRAQGFRYAGYRIFAAEVASTTNELLLYHDLMAHATSKKTKAY